MIIIETIKELEQLASLFGFNLEFDNQGQIVLYTGLAIDQNNELVPLECLSDKDNNQ